MIRSQKRLMTRSNRIRILISSLLFLLLLILQMSYAFAGRFEDGMSFLKVGEFEKAKALFIEEVQAGNVDAQYQLLLLWPKHLSKDFFNAEMIKIFQDAAQEGKNLLAWTNWGIINENGLGIPKNPEIALELYQGASVAGNASSQYKLALAYQYGQLGLDRLPLGERNRRALELYERSVKQGFTSSQFMLALAYQYGQLGLDQLPDAERNKRALELYEEAVKQGNADAQHELAWAYQYGELGLDQLPEAERNRRALELYEASVKQGNSTSQIKLAFAYEYGRELGLDQLPLSVRNRRALELYETSAKQGVAWAQYNLALVYQSGRLGLGKDPARAAQLFRSAEKLGDNYADERLFSFVLASQDEVQFALDTQGQNLTVTEANRLMNLCKKAVKKRGADHLIECTTCLDKFNTMIIPLCFLSNGGVAHPLCARCADELHRNKISSCATCRKDMKLDIGLGIDLSGVKTVPLPHSAAAAAAVEPTP